MHKALSGGVPIEAAIETIAKDLISRGMHVPTVVSYINFFLAQDGHGTQLDQYLNVVQGGKVIASAGALTAHFGEIEEDYQEAFERQHMELAQGYYELLMDGGYASSLHSIVPFMVSDVVGGRLDNRLFVDHLNKLLREGGIQPSV